MSNKLSKYPIRGVLPEATVIAGRVSVDGSDNAAVVAGRGFTVSQSGATLTVTWRGAWKNTFAIIPASNHTELTPIVGTITTTSFTIPMGATPTGTRQINFIAVVSDSSMPTT